MGYGDRLASGGRSATFSAAPKMTDEQWRKLWEPESDTKGKVNGEQLQRKSS